MDSRQTKPPPDFESIDGALAHRRVSGLFGFSNEEQLQQHMLDHPITPLLDGNTAHTPLESNFAHWTPPLDARGMPRIPNSIWKLDGLNSPAGPWNQGREAWGPNKRAREEEEDASQEHLIEGLEGLGLGIDMADEGGYDGEGYKENLEDDLDEDDDSENETFPVHTDQSRIIPEDGESPHAPSITFTPPQPRDGDPRGNLEQVSPQSPSVASSNSPGA
ncbi:hypothetical protein AYO20_10946 [Fonsecaea nubica]|uniref:Uncharacterized protein n=1 Tax=Fonsecaea nubica TaxID=856822 RepID=A0A178C390_9EURO|nr:hypothetical protein AYO20_10946 [Fonsecaea nubica]OAL23696.1 hypothetical protein AYO20_10946 [Fonsecaea nubica]